MRRLFLVLCLLLAVPAMAAGLLDNRPSSTLGAINNSNDFLPVRDAFRLNLIDSTPETIKLRFVPTEGYYLYRHKFAFSTEPADIALATPQLPPGEQKHDEYFGDVEVYHGILDVDIPRPTDDQRPFTLVVTYQGCADKGLCYPPETERLNIGGTPVSTAVAEAAAPAAKSWGWRELALFFLAGLGLTFTPCVLPMLPILSGVVLRGQVGGLRGFSLSLAYVLPMAACFALLGALMGMFGAQLNLQARLQSVWVLAPFALFFAIFALAMFGVFELKLPQAISNRLDRVANRTQGGSLWGAAVLGVVSSLLVSPCVSAPLAGALLYISASGDALGGGLKLFALGLGMGAPLLLVATGGAAWLPKSGPWMTHVKTAFGFVILALPVFLLERIIGDVWGLRLWSMLGVAFFGWAFITSLGLNKPWQRIGQIVLLAAALVSVRPLQDWVFGQAVTQSQAHLNFTRISNVESLNAALANARGKPVMLDLYADWCVACKEFEKYTFSDPQVQQALQNTVLLQADVTANSAQDVALLKHLQVLGLPTILFFDEDGNEQPALRVTGFMDAAAFRAHLRDRQP